MKVPEYGRDATKGIATAMSMSFSMPPNLMLFLWMMLTKYGMQSFIWRFCDNGRPEVLTGAVCTGGATSRGSRSSCSGAAVVNALLHSSAQCPALMLRQLAVPDNLRRNYLVCRYGVVTCYSLQMFIFMIFVGMVLSGSYPVVRLLRCISHCCRNNSKHVVVLCPLPRQPWWVSVRRWGALQECSTSSAAGASQQNLHMTVL